MTLRAMRHKYESRGIVFSRQPLGEANALVTVLTPHLGLIRARAQGVRKSGAKLAVALTTFAESELVLVRGKEGWRIAGAVLVEQWARRLEDATARARAVRVCGLLSRLLASEVRDADLFMTVQGFFDSLIHTPPELHEAAELLVVERALTLLGFAPPSTLDQTDRYTQEVLRLVEADRAGYISRINQGISASGL